MTTEESNVFIAEFMGFKKDAVKNFYRVPKYYIETILWKDWCTINEFEFDFSWNWLMPVVEKIEEDKNIHFKIYYKSCLIFNFTDVIVSRIENTKIKAVWKSVIDYIILENGKNKNK